MATGAAAHDIAGPSLMVSYVVAGLTCIFAALCYAEFASMAPVAGSAYTYAYTTLGELAAWIIRWDLVLEYAVGAATVANGWSGYFQGLLSKPAMAKLGLTVPFLLSGAPYKYDHGHILPNMQAYHGEVRVTQGNPRFLTRRPRTRQATPWRGSTPTPGRNWPTWATRRSSRN